MTCDEVLRLMDKAKEIGIHSVHVKSGDGTLLKFSFHPPKSIVTKVPESVSEFPFIPDVKPEDLVRPASPLDDMTPEEILYYAVPHYDEIQSEKEAHKKKLEEETK